MGTCSCSADADLTAAKGRGLLELLLTRDLILPGCQMQTGHLLLTFHLLLLADAGLAILLQPFASTDGITQMVKAAEQHAEELSVLSGEHALCLPGCAATGWLQQAFLVVIPGCDGTPCPSTAYSCGQMWSLAPACTVALFCDHSTAEPAAACLAACAPPAAQRC